MLNQPPLFLEIKYFVGLTMKCWNMWHKKPQVAKSWFCFHNLQNLLWLKIDTLKFLFQTWIFFLKKHLHRPEKISPLLSLVNKHQATKGRMPWPFSFPGWVAEEGGSGCVFLLWQGKWDTTRIAWCFVCLNICVAQNGWWFAILINHMFPR